MPRRVLARSSDIAKQVLTSAITRSQCVTLLSFSLTLVLRFMYNPPMTSASESNPYDDALQKAQAELAEVEARRATLLKLIDNLKELARADMYELTPPPDYAPEGMTSEVRKILSLTMAHLSAVQIRDALIQRGFSEFKSPKNLLIAVHTVLGRIEKELDVIERDGKPAYKKKQVQLDKSFLAAIYGFRTEEEMKAAMVTFQNWQRQFAEQMANAAKAFQSYKSENSIVKTADELTKLKSMK